MTGLLLFANIISYCLIGFLICIIIWIYSAPFMESKGEINLYHKVYLSKKDAYELKKNYSPFIFLLLIANIIFLFILG